MKINKADALISFFISVSFLNIFNSYFEQDEWHNFGWHIYNFGHYANNFASLFKTYVDGPLPVTQFFNVLNYVVFGVQNIFPAIFVLVLIFANSLLWLRGINSITKNRLIAIGSLFFGYFNFFGSQGITWVLPAISVQLSFFFFLVFLNLFNSYLKNKNNTYLFFAIASSFLALLSKQTIAFLFLLPISYLTSLKQEALKKLFIVILAVALVLVILIQIPTFKKIGMNRFSDKRSIVLNSFVIPIKSASQILSTDVSLIRNVSLYSMTNYYKNTDPNSGYTIGTDFFSILFSFALMTPILVIIFQNKKKNQLTIFSLVGYYLSFVPFFFDKYSTGTGFLESRYYFLPGFFQGLIVFSFIDEIVKKIKTNKNYFIRTFFISFLLLIISLFFFIQLLFIQNDIKDKNILTNKRKELLVESSKIINRDDYKKFIIFIDDVSHPNTTLENKTGLFFQTGFLYPFLVFNHEKVHYSVFENDDFWAINFSGVKKTDDFEIGIFYNKADLFEYLAQNPEMIDHVFGFTFDYNMNEGKKFKSNFTDIIHANFYDSTSTLKNEIYEKLR